MALLDKVIQAYDKGRGYTDYDQVSKTFSDIQKRFAEKDAADRNTYDESLLKLEPDPTVPGPYSVSKKRDPEAPSFQGPSELERWKRQIDAMVTSGNPTLVKQGLASLGNYRDKATASTSATPSNMNKMLSEIGIYPGTPEHSKLMMQAITRTPYEKEGDKYIPPGTVKGLQVKEKDGVWTDVPALTKFSDITGETRYKPKTPPVNEAAKIAGVRNARKQFKMMKANLYEPDGTPNLKVQRLAWALRMDPTTGMLAELGARAGTDMSSDEINRAKQVRASTMTALTTLLRAETGAEMKESELENAFQRFSPSFNDSPELVKNKLRAFEYFLDNVATLIDPDLKIYSNEQSEERNESIASNIDMLADQIANMSPSALDNLEAGKVKSVNEIPDVDMTGLKKWDGK